MKPHKVIGIFLILAAVVSAVGWQMLPSIQSARRQDDTRASVDVERARRSLHGHSAAMHRVSALLDALEEAGLDVDALDPDAFAAEALDDYQQLHERKWDDYEPRDWMSDPQRTAQASYGNVARQMSEGLAAQAKLIVDNQGFLTDALLHIDAALSASPDHAEANRLKGVILYHSGLAKRLEGEMLRLRMAPYRQELSDLAAGVLDNLSITSLVAGTGIEASIESLSQRAVEAETAYAEMTRSLGALDERIASLSSRLAAAESRAALSRASIEAMEEAGIDFSDPNGGEAFGEKLLAADKVYREALREAQALEFGVLNKARIDRSGDYLHGQYLENGSATDLSVQMGLSHYRDAQVALAAEMDKRREDVAAMQADILRLEGLRDGFRGKEAAAAKAIQASRARGGEVYDSLNRIEDEAYVLEDEAIDFFDRASQSSKEASDLARLWVSDARDRTQGLSPEAEQRSAFAQRKQDDWIGGYMAAQVVDAKLAKAWIHYRRFESSTLLSTTLKAIGEPLELQEADPAVQAENAMIAHEAGIEVLNEATAELKGVHRAVDRHWAVIAQEATLIDLIGLFGHQDATEHAIEAYKLAIEGREDKPYIRKIQRRLSMLEAARQ